MKSYFLNNKYQVGATAFLVLLFFFSVMLRQERLNAELIPGEEWISAHVLITNEIWEQNGGPSEYAFCPIYTYGEGSQTVRAIGGVMDKDNNYYYVSYPPFAFIFSYYGMKLLGGHSVHHLRSLNLILHFFCAFLIYLLIYKLSGKTEDHFSIAGVFAAFLYLFSSGTLWIHSVMYFSDILMQLFILLILLLTLKLIQKDYKSELRILVYLGICVFLGSYTEWLGIFMSFFTGIILLVFYFIKRNKTYLKAFFVFGTCSVLALSLTIFQYSSISGFDNLVEASSNKYNIRSGHAGPELAEAGYDFSNPESYDKIRTNFNKHFLMVVNLFGITTLLIIPLIAWKKTRLKMQGIRQKILIILLLLLPVVAHILVFFNFNAIHDFANLKAGLLAIICIGVIVLLIEHSLDIKFKVVLVGLLVFLGFSRAYRDYSRYLSFYDLDQINTERVFSANTMREHSPISQMAFSNMKNLNPEYMYLSKHTPFYIPDTSNLLFLMNIYDLDSAKFYNHSGDTLSEILTFEKIKDQLIVKGRKTFH